MKVFISYRRDDSIVHARLIHNELAARFGADDVFMDIDDIDYGDDFVRLIDEHLARADVVVAVIGPRWNELLQRRLQADDYVRHELSSALARRMRVIPVLVGGAPPPGTELPADLAELRRLNFLTLRHWGYPVVRIGLALSSLLIVPLPDSLSLNFESSPQCRMDGATGCPTSGCTGRHP